MDARLHVRTLDGAFCSFPFGGHPRRSGAMLLLLLLYISEFASLHGRQCMALHK